MPEPRPPRYPIGAVARLTGLSADTLRAWERRTRWSRLRDDRGRVYSGTDVKRLQLLAAAVDRGHAIGRVAALSDAELEAVIAEPAGTAREWRRRCRRTWTFTTLLTALRAFDRPLWSASSVVCRWPSTRENSFTACSSASSSTWATSGNAERLNIAQEHLLSGAVRNLLGAMVRSYSKEDVPRRLLFATPSGERHEFGILAAAMLAAAGGLGVTYIGADVPARLIVDSAARSGVEVVVLGLIYTDATHELRREIDYVVITCRAGSSCG